MTNNVIQRPISLCLSFCWFPFLADCANGRDYATVMRLPVVCRRLSSVTLCIVAKRCVLEARLSVWSYIRNRLVPKWMTLTFV